MTDDERRNLDLVREYLAAIENGETGEALARQRNYDCLDPW